MTSEERNARERERYAFFKERHLCVKCGRKVELNKTMCSECLEKKSAYNSIYFAKADNAIKHADRKRELHAKRRELGLCRCGKERYPEHTVCYECMLKNRRLARARYVPKQRTYASVLPQGKPRFNHPWNSDNRLIFTTNIQMGGDNR